MGRDLCAVAAANDGYGGVAVDDDKGVLVEAGTNSGYRGIAIDDDERVLEEPGTDVTLVEAGPEVTYCVILPGYGKPMPGDEASFAMTGY